jgi:hypothetical protein
MSLQKVDVKFIPVDKSIAIRRGFLDLLAGSDSTVRLLKESRDKGTDLKSLIRASEEWKSSKVIHVGESGTLLRFLKFASWKLELGKGFVAEGTLNGRNICNDPSIVNWPLPALLSLDDGTSQWASAAVLMGSSERMPLSHPRGISALGKLELSYRVRSEWNARNGEGSSWKLEPDKTIWTQANAFLNRVDGRVSFAPKDAEDYCFARAFGIMGPSQAMMMWPSLAGHESNRFISIEKALEQFKSHTIVDSSDHRVVQAVAMLARANGIGAQFQNPDCVNKSWPQFWNFLYTYTHTAAT